MKLTHENLNAARTAKGGWTKAQLEAIGVAWPPVNGWRNNVVGKEISDADYQRFCDLASVRANPSKPGESLLPKQPASMDSAAVLAWLNEKLGREGIARTELESRIVALHSKLDALRDEVREARRSSADHDSSLAPTLPQKTPTAPPWEV